VTRRNVIQQAVTLIAGIIIGFAGIWVLMRYDLADSTWALLV